MGNKTSQPRRKWVRRFVVVFAVLVLLPGVALLVVESLRQLSIARAESALEAVVKEARAEFPEDDDWRVWYRDLLGDAEGGDRFSEWCERVYNLGESDQPDYDFLWEIEKEAERVHDVLREGAAPDKDPDPSLLYEFLMRTDALALEADGLMHHEGLIAEPGLDIAGLPTRSWLPTLFGFRVLQYRAFAHLWLGNDALAWHEVERMGKLWLSYKSPAGMHVFMLQSSVFNVVQHTFVILAAHSAPSQGALELVPFELPKFEMSEQIVFSLANFAATAKFSGRELANPGPGWLIPVESREWFGWLRSDPANWRDDFTEPLKNARSATDYSRQVLAWYRHYHYGTPQPNSPLVVRHRDVEFGYEEVARENEAWAAYAASRANLVFALREAEAAGTPLHEFKFDADQQPGLTLKPVPESEGGGVKIVGHSPRAADNDPPDTTHIKPLTR
jgi:hypothetical protein